MYQCDSIHRNIVISVEKSLLSTATPDSATLPPVNDVNDDSHISNLLLFNIALGRSLISHSPDTSLIELVNHNLPTYSHNLYHLINAFRLTDYDQVIMFANALKAFDSYKLYHLRTIRFDSRGIFFDFYERFFNRFQSFHATDCRISFICTASPHPADSDLNITSEKFFCDFVHTTDNGGQCYYNIQHDAEYEILNHSDPSAAIKTAVHNHHQCLHPHITT